MNKLSEGEKSRLTQEAAEGQLRRYLVTNPGSRALAEAGGGLKLARKHLQHLEKWPFTRGDMRQVIEGASEARNQEYYRSALDQMEAEGHE